MINSYVNRQKLLLHRYSKYTSYKEAENITNELNARLQVSQLTAYRLLFHLRKPTVREFSAYQRFFKTHGGYKTKFSSGITTA
jgi:hypothetical protein